MKTFSLDKNKSQCLICNELSGKRAAKMEENGRLEQLIHQQEVEVMSLKEAKMRMEGAIEALTEAMNEEGCN